VLETASSVSDESKIEALEGDDPAPEAAVTQAPTASRELMTPERLALLRKVVPVLWLLGTIAAGIVSDIQLAFLVAAGGVLVLVITLMWSSVQSLTGGSPLGFEEALGMGAPSKVEEQKRAVLRALKDLEFERGVGKISAEDYAELSAKYRAEAKSLMQSLDDAQGPARKQVEAELKRRLEREGLASALEHDALEPENPDKLPASAAQEPS
jgi:hypothetical protein